MQNPPLKFTLRVSSNFSASDAAVVKLTDAVGNDALMVTLAQFDAAQRDPRTAQSLQKFRRARQLQILDACMQAAQRLIDNLEAQEAGWPKFDRSYAQRLHKPFVG